ncbi:MAG TPA: hypothetical protein VGY55_18455 [Pirellulales bacterium]|jgi:hypothetical protein|nr:hypothetical protein [Pirellulales bacterium]
METSLHRELKRLYAGEAAQLEVRLAGYRIDAVVDGELIEVQHGPLTAIRDKVRRLLEAHRVRVVKPVVARKMLIYRRRKAGRVARRRLSPKRGGVLDLFDELIHFTRVFPHPRLTLEVPLVEIEEWRYPGHGRRRWRRDSDFQVEDQKLIAIQSLCRLQTIGDLAALIACPLPSPFHTAHLAAGLDIPRWSAQRIAYCMHRMGAIHQVGKQRNAWLYCWNEAAFSTGLTRLTG